MEICNSWVQFSGSALADSDSYNFGICNFSFTGSALADSGYNPFAGSAVALHRFTGWDSVVFHLALPCRWMCSILLVLVCTLIISISISDFVQFQTDHLELIFVPLQNGHFNEKASAQARPCSGQASVVFAPERDSSPVSTENQKHQAEATEAPFSRSDVHCPLIARNGEFGSGTMEMFDVQEDMHGQTRMLCTMWSILEVMFRPRFCATGSQTISTTSAVEAESVECRRRLERLSMDTISTKAPVPQGEGPTDRLQNNRPAREKSKGKAKEEQPSYGPQLSPALPSLDPPWMSGTVPPPSTPSSTLIQNNAGNVDSKEEKEKDRHMRSLVAALRRHKDELPEDVQALVKEATVRSGQEETKILHSAVSQHGRAKKGAPGSSGRTSTDACGMEELPSAISGSMVQIYRAVHAARTPVDGPPQGCAGKLGSSQGQPWCVQGLRRTGLQGRLCCHERHRGHRAQGCRDFCRSEDCGKFSGPCIKSPSLAQTSRTSRAAGGRAGPTAKTPEDVCAGGRCRPRRRWKSSFFWGARVNTFATCIAHGLPTNSVSGATLYRPASGATVLDASPHGTDQSVFNPALKWNHSVLFENDFVDEWSAADRAFHLAQEFALYPSAIKSVGDCSATASHAVSACCSQSVQYPVDQGLYKDAEANMLDVDFDLCSSQKKSHSFSFEQPPNQMRPSTEICHHCEDSDPVPGSRCDRVDRQHSDLARCNELRDPSFDHILDPADSHLIISAAVQRGNPHVHPIFPSDHRVHAPASHVVAKPHMLLGKPLKITSCRFKPPLRQTQPKDKVHFCSEIDLYIGCDEQWKFHKIHIHEDSLQMNDKPWSLTMGDEVGHGGKHHTRSHSETFSSFDQHSAQSNPKHLSHPEVGGSHVPSRGWSRIIHESCHENSKHLPHVSISPLHCITQCRREHENPLGWMPQNGDTDDDEDQDDHVPPDLAADPPFFASPQREIYATGF